MLFEISKTIKRINKDELYVNERQKISANTKKVIMIMMNHFGQLVTSFILNNFIIKDTFESFNNIDKQAIWKGVLIKRLLSAKKLEAFIKEKL